MTFNLLIKPFAQCPVASQGVLTSIPTCRSGCVEGRLPNVQPEGLGLLPAL